MEIRSTGDEIPTLLCIPLGMPETHSWTVFLGNLGITGNQPLGVGDLSERMESETRERNGWLIMRIELSQLGNALRLQHPPHR
jgi:hypothetical protein